MPTDADHLATLPPDQQRIWAKCYHPTGPFIPFPKEAIEQSIPDRFEQMVRSYPSRPAVQDRHETLTYAELNEQANRVAHAILAQRGSGAEPIALLFDKGTRHIAATLGVLKAGKFYLPLDPSYPPRRTLDILKNAEVGCVLTSTTQLSLLDILAPQRCDVLNVDVLDTVLSSGYEKVRASIAPDTFADLIYTSGSTGQPKGVVRTHRFVLQKVMAYTNIGHLGAADRVSLLPACGSSAAVHITWSPLLNGATLCVFDVQQEGLEALARWLIQERITVYYSTPTVFRYFAETLTGQGTFPELRLIFVAGEPVLRQDIALFQKHFATNCFFINTMGATETPNFAWYFIEKRSQLRGAQVPAGYPLTEDPEVLLLDDNGHDVGIDQTGEIVVKSRYLAHGYWRRADLTQTRFVGDPIGGQVRRYYTGDLGRRLPDGCLLSLGRKDFQVRIRGNQVNIAEIERALLDLDLIREAVVMVREDRSAGPHVVAYLVPFAWPAPTVSRLRQTLSSTLPDYMIPSEYVMLKSFPVTPNGKVDRRALPTPERSRPMLDAPFVAPRTPIEAQLARMWEEVLDLEQVGIHDHFLDIGGHSLLAMQLLTRVIQTFHVDLPLRTLLESPTVAEMAVAITQHRSAQADPAMVSRLLAEIEALEADELKRYLANDPRSGT